MDPGNAGAALWRDISLGQAHHCQAALPLDRLSAAQRAARLLRRVQLFLALAGRQAGGRPVALATAARRACLGHDGVVDELGAALLQAVGVYPAGTLVRLRGGEAGVVVGRGPRANLPLVAALADATGLPLARPHLRHTALERHALQGLWPAGAAAMLLQRAAHGPTAPRTA